MRRCEWLKLKPIIVARLGGKCLDCGMSDIRFLEFDHINGDGFLRRWRSNGTYRSNQDDVLRHFNRGTIGEVYQLRCSHCHKEKTYRNKENTGAWNKTRTSNWRECKSISTTLVNGQFDMFAEHDQSTEVPSNGNGRGYPPVGVSPVVRVHGCEVTVNYRQQDLALSSPDNQAPETIIEESITGTSKAVRE